MGDAVTTQDGARELLTLDVREVSLVDKPAIRREFVVVKRLEDDGGSVDISKEESVEPKTADTQKADTSPDVNTVNTQKADASGEGASTETVAVDKAAGDMIKQLANDHLMLAANKLMELANSAGTMERKDVWPMLDSIHGLVYGVEQKLLAISKSIGHDTTEVEKGKVGNKRVTAARLATIKGALDQLTSLVKDLEGDDSADAAADHAPVTTEATMSAELKKALEEGLKPLRESVTAITTSVEKALTAKPDSTDAKQALEQLADVKKRLDALEGISKSGEDGTTKVEPIKKGDNLWSGLI